MPASDQSVNKESAFEKFLNKRRSVHDQVTVHLGKYWLREFFNAGYEYGIKEKRNEPKR